MKAVILETLRQRRTSTIWWSIGLIIYISLVMLVYPVFRDQASQFDQALQIPESSKSLFTDTNSLFSPAGYLDSNIYYLMLPLLFAILAISLGSSLISRDERNHTIELVLSRPVSRGRYLLGKAIAGSIILAIVGFVTAVTGAIEVVFIDFGDIGPLDITLVTAICLLLSVVLGALAYAIVGMGRVSRASIGVASLVGFASYLFTSLSGTVHWLEWPAKLLPFHYFHPADLLAGTVSWGPIIGYCISTVILVAIAHTGFRRRDLE